MSISDNLLVLDEQEIKGVNLVNHFLPFSISDIWP